MTNAMIFSNTTQTSATAHQFQEILTRIWQKNGVIAAVLSTIDGLPLANGADESNHMAAMTGFLFASIRQATAMMSWQACKKVTLQLADGSLLVGKTFEAGNTSLFLTVVFDKTVNYERFLAGIIQEIQATAEG